MPNPYAGKIKEASVERVFTVIDSDVEDFVGLLLTFIARRWDCRSSVCGDTACLDYGHNQDLCCQIVKSEDEKIRVGCLDAYGPTRELGNRIYSDQVFVLISEVSRRIWWTLCCCSCWFFTC